MLLLGWAWGQTLEGASLVHALQKGGYIIYFRHAATDFSQTDTDGPELKDCTKQRNLSASGREQSRQIGEQFVALNIPLGTIQASPYCRTRDTAQLAFGRFEVNPNLRSNFVELRRLLSVVPSTASNTVLVAHQFILRDATEVILSEGEAAIFEPMGERGYRLVARVMAEDWVKLVTR